VNCAGLSHTCSKPNENITRSESHKIRFINFENKKLALTKTMYQLSINQLNKLKSGSDNFKNKLQILETVGLVVVEAKVLLDQLPTLFVHYKIYVALNGVAFHKCN
jgi:hypothetical protein